MTLLALYSAFLSRLSGQEDIVIGSPIAGRPHADLEAVLGMFVNTLALRTHPAGNKTFTDFLKEVKQTALEAYELSFMLCDIQGNIELRYRMLQIVPSKQQIIHFQRLLFHDALLYSFQLHPVHGRAGESYRLAAAVPAGRIAPGGARRGDLVLP